MFEKHVECGYINMPRNEASGEIKGFAFVEVNSEDEILKAVDALNGIEVGDRPLRVSKVLPKEQIRSKKTNRKSLEVRSLWVFILGSKNVVLPQKLPTRTNCL
jgi:RNA recognition motif-containing protein